MYECIYFLGVKKNINIIILWKIYCVQSWHSITINSTKLLFAVCMALFVFMYSFVISFSFYSLYTAAPCHIFGRDLIQFSRIYRIAVFLMNQISANLPPFWKSRSQYDKLMKYKLYTLSLWGKAYTRLTGAYFWKKPDFDYHKILVLCFKLFVITVH